MYRSENNKPEKLASLSKEEINLFKDFEKQIINYTQFKQKAIMFKNIIEAEMHGKEKNTNLIEKLDILKKNIDRNQLNSTDLKDFNEKFNVLYQAANGSLRSGGSLNFGAKLK